MHTSDKSGHASRHHELPPSRAGSRLLATLALAQMLIGVDYNIVFVALPEIASLGFGTGDLQWVVTAYAIGFGGLLLLCGRLVDHVGRLQMFSIGLTLFAVGSTIGGLAPNPAALIAGRAVQGVGGAALAPATLALLTSNFPEGPRRNRALGIWGAAGSAGMVLGSILGGVLTEHLGWRAVFLVNLPIVAIIAALAVFSAPRTSVAGPKLVLDARGAAFATATATLIVAAFTLAASTGWQSATPWLLLAGSIITGTALVISERRAAAPILDPRALRHRPLTVGTASTFVFMAGFGAIAYFATLYFQEARGLSAALTGLAFVAPCAGVLVGTRIGAKLSNRGTRRTLVVGNAIGAAFTALLAATISSDAPLPVILSLLFALSVGQGITFTAMFATATAGVPDTEQGAASGIATTGQQLGGAVGLAVLVSVTAASADATRTALIGITIIIVIGAIIGLAAPRTAQV